jgi:hypothetical protein
VLSQSRIITLFFENAACSGDEGVHSVKVVLVAFIPIWKVMFGGVVGSAGGATSGRGASPVPKMGISGGKQSSSTASML